MKKLTILIGFFLAACSEQGGQAVSVPLPERPMRIASLDYCADQYVLKLVEKSRILAVSPGADEAYSYMRDAATGVPVVRPLAEDVLILQPDLVVRSYGGGPKAGQFFARAGVPVLNVGYAASMEDIKSVTRDMARGLGVPERGEALVRQMENRLTAVVATSSRHTARPEALYMTPGGVTAGPGTLIDEMLHTAGLDNFETTPGWSSIPLERLAYDHPDLIAAAFFEQSSSETWAWSAMRHAVARDQIETLPVVPLDGAWTACGSWYLVDAIEALAAAPLDTSEDEETTP